MSAERKVILPTVDEVPERYRMRVDGAALELDIREELAPSEESGIWNTDFRTQYLPQPGNFWQGRLWGEVTIPSAESDEFGFYGSFRRTGAEFREPNLVYFQVPGNAADLTPDGESHWEDQRGYELLPHNCDSIPQQLGFVFGLAKLEEISRRDVETGPTND